ncbi:MAG: hypothetical protein WC887_00290 [Candidatus Paceibacterota bacterium]|jgi:hypothetical protein
MRFGFLITLSLIFLLPLAVSAQAISNEEAFTMSVNPQYPAPYSQAVLSLLSSSLDLNNAIMTVSVAGKEVYKGSVRPTAIPVGGAGSVVSAKVTVTSGGASYNQTISIQPQDVVLVAEPISSSPPLYLGKSLVPLEGDVRVVAMANLRGTKGEIIDTTTLSYSWTVDDTQIANASGIGKQSITVASPFQYRTRKVSVAVMSQDGNLVGGASLSLSALDPSVRLYKNDPLLGILYDHALSSSYAISNAEETLYAAPFSLPTTNGAPLIQWFLSGTIAQTGNSITLRPTGKGQGNASLSLTASSGGSTKATENLSLSFGTASSGFSLFGL